QAPAGSRVRPWSPRREPARRLRRPHSLLDDTNGTRWQSSPSPRRRAVTEGRRAGRRAGQRVGRDEGQLARLKWCIQPVVATSWTLTRAREGRMRRRRWRGHLSLAERDELWRRWRQGEALRAIARALDR